MVVKLALKRNNENIQIWSRYSLFKNTGCSLPASSSAALNDQTIVKFARQFHLSKIMSWVMADYIMFKCYWVTSSALHVRHRVLVQCICLNDQQVYDMTTSSNGNIFRVTGPLCGDFPGQRWIPLTKASDTELWCFLWSPPGQTVE